MIGFVFADESEAKAFYKKVSSNKGSQSSPLSLLTPFTITHTTCSKTPLREKEKERCKRRKGRQIYDI